MKLNTSREAVEMGNTVSHSDFSIAMNAKTFRVLSDGLYENKIGSIVRELSSNAADSHIEAGKPDVPFQIHLPNAFEPWFSVKDWGVGLNDEEILTVYTSYFQSTKEQTNDMIGAFGLGSKTPFSYRDQFNVISTKDGVTRVYTAYIAENGMPSIACQVENETDEPNGVEVQVSVETADFMDFRDAVENQLRFFKNKPEVINTGHREIEWPNFHDNANIVADNYLIGVSTAYKTFGGGFNFRGNGIFVVQGGVGYPINIDNLRSEGFDDSLMNFLHGLSREGAIIYFNIGDIEVTASREGISYTPDTIKNIEKVCREIREDMRKRLETDVNAFSTDWEKLCFINRSSNLFNLFGLSAADFGVKGTTITTGSECYNVRDWVTNRVTDNHNLPKTLVNYTLRKWHDRTRDGNPRRINMLNDISFGLPVNVYPSEKVVVFLRDTNKRPVARLKHYWVKNDQPIIYVFEYRGESHKKDKTIKEQINEIKNNLGGVNVHLVSELDEPPKNSPVNRGANPKAFRYPYEKPHSNVGESRHWEKVYEVMDDLTPAIYVTMDSHYIEPNDISDLKYVKSALKNGDVDMEVYALNKKRSKSAEKKQGWTHVSEVAKELKEKYRSMMKDVEAAIYYEALNDALKNFVGVSRRMAWSSNESTLFFMDRLDKIECNDIKKIYKAINTISKRRDKLLQRAENYQGVISEAKSKGDIYHYQSHEDAIQNHHLVKIAASLKERYPLAFNEHIRFETHMMDEGEAERMYDHLISYINTIHREGGG